MSRLRSTSPRIGFDTNSPVAPFARNSRKTAPGTRSGRATMARLEALESRRLLSDVVHGLSATYVNGIDPGSSGVTRVDPNISFYWGTSGSPVQGVSDDRFAVRWTGQIQPKFSETYTFVTRSDEAERLWIDGKLVIDAWDRHSLQTDVSKPVTLQAGKRYDIKMEYFDFVGTAVARLMWMSPSQSLEDVPESQLYAQGPFSNSSATTNQPIQAEDFDTGINSIAYKDVDSANIGGAYRDTGVDIEPCGDTGGGYQVGYIRSGEWLSYSIDVPTTGKYSFDIRMGAKGGGGTMHAELDGADITGRLSVPDTGAWSAYETVTTGGISIGAGHHILRLSSDVAGSSGYVGNYNWWQLRLQTQPLVSVTANGTRVTSDQTLPVNFGSFTVGDSASETFLVTNDGTGTLDLGTPQLPAGFTLAEGLNSTLAPGASDSFTVRMDTSSATTRDGVIQFSTNDVLWNPVAFGITGVVLAAPPPPVSPPPPPPPVLPPPPPPPPTTNDPVYLKPGTGFTGASVPDPKFVFNDTSIAGYDAKAIARWDVVPYQTFTDTFNVGVVAFHMNGIDHVSFSVNGGEWSNVYQPALNPQTNVNEYFATLKASDFKDGQLEVRAIAYPAKAGVPRVLQGSTDSGNGEVSMFLNANGGGTLPALVRYVSPTGSDTTGDGSEANPFASIVKASTSIQAAQGSADGGTIYLMAGSYVVKSAEWNQGVTTSSRWLTITHAPGVSESDVTITGVEANSRGSNDGLMTNLVAVSGVTLNGPIQGSGHNVDSVWYDHVDVNGPGRDLGTVFRPWNFSNGYVTNSTISDVQDAVHTFSLARNVQVQRVAQLSFYNTPLVINSSVSDSDRGTNLLLHPDVFFMYGSQTNVVAYGITATDRINAFGLRFQDSTSDVAVVNCNLSVTTPWCFQMERPYQNMFFKDTNLGGAPTGYQGTFSAIDIVFDNTTFYQSPGPHDGVIFR